ncbi:MAG: glycine--tRNA ligase [Candidatus Magasanikbacteria bacterium RIFCSPHIGHO2_01_FULL_50_8]|uniref:Glycine--tRNA ligase n=2 Tax=Candidatus Magasanikiibacteriota TaxID=1752731 RepID=A0A1F6LMB1_9BACT|nr:MAG: glycine--tRNA ligase [Candidatus Magasanikbacteria bacterium RIFCSPHIGHO2_01_FULL_50_8]OGH68274.1 MAG: glycine--tRNA ligase [Candidatus Magasanikbacteria bacterium RIFCSPHIGHO2_02_FULL_50_9b]
MEKLVSLCKRRGFVFPGSEIYGGLANSWDYGPLGVELKNNIKMMWWKMFVSRRSDMVAIDAALLMNPKVWEASGHVATFSDPLVECKACHARLRADQLEGVCPTCGKKEFTEARAFNLMLRTWLGPTQDDAAVVYLRPETAQAMFVDFKNVLETTRRRLPFGVAQIGKAFRNEITPGNFIFRQREFEQMEIEYFIREEEWEAHFEHWLGEMKKWVALLGVKPERLHYVDIPDEDRAFYSKRTVDVEYDYPFGQKELYGLAYRTNYDLGKHEEHSGAELKYTNPDDQKEKFVPHVIEPSFGVDRSLLVALLEAYDEDEVDGESRVVMRFPYWMAPVKVAVLPLSKKSELSEPAQKLAQQLREADFAVEYDETQSIGKRYRRQDEIGTPFCVTFDFDSLTDGAVTVRDRDTMAQVRVPLDKLVTEIKQRLA